MNVRRKVYYAGVAILLSLTQVPSSGNASFHEPTPVKEDVNVIQPQAGGLAVFFGGILVGYVIGGGIQYVTGKSAEDWVAAGLHNMEEKILSFSSGLSNDYQISISSNGYITSLCTTPPCRGYDSVEDDF